MKRIIGLSILFVIVGSCVAMKPRPTVQKHDPRDDEPMDPDGVSMFYSGHKTENAGRDFCVAHEMDAGWRMCEALQPFDWENFNMKTKKWVPETRSYLGFGSAVWLAYEGAEWDVPRMAKRITPWKCRIEPVAKQDYECVAKYTTNTNEATYSVYGTGSNNKFAMEAMMEKALSKCVNYTGSALYASCVPNDMDETLTTCFSEFICPHGVNRR